MMAALRSIRRRGRSDLDDGRLCSPIPLHAVHPRFPVRICPGKLLGESNTFIVMATLLATLDISSPDGQPLAPEYQSNLVRCVFARPDALVG